MESEKWTDEELIQVYDLQEKYAEKVIDFVRHGSESEVLKFLQILPDLNEYYLRHEKDIFRRKEFVNEYGNEAAPQGRYVYKDLFEQWQGADTLREVFEEKYQWDFATARPETLAVFAGNMEIAFETYSIERYEKLRQEIPRALMSKIKNLILNYPKEIQDKACRKAIYGYTNGISSGALLKYSNEHMPEFERVQWVVQQESADTIVSAYDLQSGLVIYNPEMRDNHLTSAVRDFVSDKQIFRLVYGDKSADLLEQADEKTISLAMRYDFVHSDEKLPIIENHRICLFGTAEQKLQIPYKSDPSGVSDKDFQIIMETESDKLEREGFSKKYHPSKTGVAEYYNQSYKIISRANSATECQPQWNIIFKDSKIITAKADEIVSSAINERLYGEQYEKFGTRPLRKVSMSYDNEKMSLSEGKERISAIILQLRSNGESLSQLKDFLELEKLSLSSANVR